MSFLRQVWVGFAAVVVTGVVASARPATGPTTRKAKVDPSTVATQAESATITLRQLQADAVSDRTPSRVRDELPTLTEEIDGRLDETASLLSGSPSLQVLDGLADDWQTIQRELAGWDKALQHRKDLLTDVLRTVPVNDDFDPVPPKGATGSDARPGRLQETEDAWAQSRQVFEFLAEHPKSDDMRARLYEAVDAADEVLQTVGLARSDIQTQLTTTYEVLHDVDVQRARVDDVVDSVRQARDDAWNRLFERDDAPIWSRAAWQPAEHKSTETKEKAVARQGQGSLRRQWQAVSAYVSRHRGRAAFHAGLFFVLAAGLWTARRWVNRWIDADPSLARATLAFTAPVATGLVLTFLAAVWIYPQAPRLFWAILGAAALLPTVYLLRRVVEPRLYFVLHALVVFYVVDQVRTVAAAVPVLARLLFLSEMLVATGLVLILIRARWNETPTSFAGWVVRFAVRGWLLVFAGCFITDAVGNVSLAELAGGAAMGGAYLAVILYAAVRIVGGLAVLLLRSRPLTLLASVRRHQPLLMGRLTAAIGWVGAAFWLVGVLAMLSARPAVFAGISWFWYLPVSLGSIHFTPSHVLVFVLTLWAAYMVSRFVQFVLNEDVYGRIHLATGSSYAINRMVHYAVLVAGFYLAMAAGGVSFTQLNLLVTALTVGLGFGLQNVVNNFVSGLILLFERPIKVGDLVQMSDATTGTVEYIGIRASIIRTPDSSEVIVPNGNLISNQLINWTLTSRQRGLTIQIAVGADADPQHVMDLLTSVAAGRPMVSKNPGPQAYLVKFTSDAFNYELRVWTDMADQWVQIRSDLSVALRNALVHEGITIK